METPSKPIPDASQGKGKGKGNMCGRFIQKRIAVLEGGALVEDYEDDDADYDEENCELRSETNGSVSAIRASNERASEPLVEPAPLTGDRPERQCCSLEAGPGMSNSYSRAQAWSNNGFASAEPFCCGNCFPLPRARGRHPEDICHDPVPE